MKITDLHKPKKQVKPVSGFTPEQAAANLEYLLQELEGLEASAALYFQDFTVPARDGKRASRRYWLLPGGVETLKDLGPERVDFVLKNLQWFKEQIKAFDVTRKWQEHDNLPYDYV